MATDAGAVEIVEKRGRIEFTVKVVPGSSRTKIAGAWGPALKVVVSAVPEGGKANAAVTRLLATVLDVKKGEVSIIGGQTQPVKRVAVSGLTADQARRRLAAF